MRVGTRASALALAQARWVVQRLRQAGAEAEIVEITTLGDRGAGAQDKSRWVSELERALLEERIDVAVHSAKDVPTQLDEGLELVAIPERADARDAICGAPGLAAVPAGARIGTSSLRRAAQIRALRDDVEVVNLRGNVDTRLRKLADGDYDAIVLARAGLERLGRTGEAGAELDPRAFVPAPGQGALALEARSGDEIAREAAERITDPAALACLRAERGLTAALGGSCHTPIGAHAERAENGGLRLRAFVGLTDGSAWVSDELEGDEDAPAELGRSVGERLLAAGARGLLERAQQVADGEEISAP
jgi:hydroxymethylbilane synthase